MEKNNDPPQQCEFNKIPWVKEADVFKLFSWPPQHSWLDHITQYVSLPLRILLTSFCVFLNLVCLTTAEKAISEADLVEVCQELDDMLLISSHDSCCVSSQNSASSRAARAPVAPLPTYTKQNFFIRHLSKWSKLLYSIAALSNMLNDLW